MILPVTYVSVLLLLIASLACLGSWVNTFKATGARWRFELFSIDFSVGGILLALIAAFTLGTLGSDLAFSDRTLVAGRTAQALALIAGGVFNLGNMLLLAAVSLLGISTAFPLSIGVALIVASCFRFRPDNLIYLIIGILVIVASVVCEIRSARLREAVVAAKVDPVPARAVKSSASATAAKPMAASVRAPSGHSAKAKPPAKGKRRKSLRGIIAALIGGVALGLFVPILQNCVPGDFGLGPYAGMLLFSVGVLGSTIVYDFYFLNITIEGAPLTFGAYFKGRPGQHFLGFSGGALCLGGLLAAMLAMTAPVTAGVPGILRLLLPLLSVPLAVLFGIAMWKELAMPPKARMALVAGVCLFTGGLVLLALGLTR
jgi:glucose uptake protein